MGNYKPDHGMLRCRYLVFLLFVSSISVCFAEEPGIYLVLVEGEPVAFHRDTTTNAKRLDPNSEVAMVHAKHLIDSHDKILQSTLQTGSYNKLYSFKHIVNGFAVHTTSSQAKKLKYAAGVKLVEKDRGAKLMTTYTPQFLGLPQGIWAEAGGDKHAGEGIVIGFVDSGINPTHPSFVYDPTTPCTSNLSHFSGACETGPRFPSSSCNGKVVSARFFSAGAQALVTLDPKVDFLSPMDASGHGSHVASTAAGNAGVPVVVNSFFYGRASGIAPSASEPGLILLMNYVTFTKTIIAVYKAIYPTIGTLADVVAAIDQAVSDGVDILTLSIGPDQPPEDSPTVLSVFEVSMLFARRAGVFVVQAAGNHGPSPLTVVSYSPWSVGVAYGTTDRTYPGSLLLGNGQKVGGVGLSGPTFGNSLILQRLVLAKDALQITGLFPRTAPYVEECQFPEALDPDVVYDSIIICTFSAGFFNQTSSITAIINTARALSVAGFIFVANPIYGDFIAEPIPYSIPGILIPKVSDAQIISRYYEEQTYRDKRGLVIKFGAQAAIGEGRVASFGGQAPVVSRLSSRGPDYIDIDRNLVDVLKPDILAPGHQIWAAWSPISALDPILQGYNYALLSGTSMATPHVVGIAALIKQQNPTWSPSMIASAISTTATKYDNNGELIMAEGFYITSLNPSTHFDFGAGHVNPTRALDPGLVISAEFGDYISFLCILPNISHSTVTAATGAWCSHSLDHPANLNLPSITISSLKGSLSLRRNFKNVGCKPETYLCSVVPPDGTTVSLSPPWFTVAPYGTQDLDILFNVTKVMNKFSFGEIVLTGSMNHIVRIPLTVKPVSLF